jgi:hypothetical protein
MSCPQSNMRKIRVGTVKRRAVLVEYAVGKYGPKVEGNVAG